MKYPPIAEHGVIGDLQTAALVDADGTVDWFCCPRFDSPSVFGSLLDAERGGYLRIAPADPGYSVRHMYLPDTAVLVTRFLSAGGVGEILDFMPVDRPTVATDRRRLLRLVRVVRGSMRFTAECRPRFDYGRADHELVLGSGGRQAVFRTPAVSLLVRTTFEMVADGRDVRGSFSLVAGELGGLALTSFTGDEVPRGLTRDELEEEFRGTVRFWHEWLAGSRYRGRWRAAVDRSAITLKLLTYAPTGAPVAAVTTALPEQIGGERNWDYRYTWIRDASLSVGALARLGFVDEARDFVRWLGSRLLDPAAGDEPLRVMYRVDGSSDLSESTVDILEGYRGSRPVRIGNGAADQLQLDIHGEAIDALYCGVLAGEPVSHEAWLTIADHLDWLAGAWDRPDEGVWETRGGRKDFVYSRLMCWVAFDRGLRLAELTRRPADTARWASSRDAIYRQIMSRGFSPSRGAFTQSYGSDVLDSSLLFMPMTGFVEPTEPRWRSTLDAIDRDLVSDSLVFRYDPAASPDGLAGDEGTFCLCSFLYVDALARAGRLDAARLAFEKMLTYASHLGLYAEEIGPTGDQLGNFPQAFTHLALIHAAVSLNDRLPA